MKIVTDTNIFLAVVLNEPERGRAITLTLGHELIAPEILPFEIGNALSAMRKRGRITRKEAMLAFGSAQNVPVDLRRIDIGKALELACEMEIYAYDAYFLQCAIANQSPILTLDSGMQTVAGRLGVKLVGKDL